MAESDEKNSEPFDLRAGVKAKAKPVERITDEMVKASAAARPTPRQREEHAKMRALWLKRLR